MEPKPKEASSIVTVKARILEFINIVGSDLTCRRILSSEVLNMAEFLALQDSYQQLRLSLGDAEAKFFKSTCLPLSPYSLDYFIAPYSRHLELFKPRWSLSGGGKWERQLIGRYHYCEFDYDPLVAKVKWDLERKKDLGRALVSHRGKHLKRLLKNSLSEEAFGLEDLFCAPEQRLQWLSADTSMINGVKTGILMFMGPHEASIQLHSIIAPSLEAEYEPYFNESIAEEHITTLEELLVLTHHLGVDQIKALHLSIEFEETSLELKYMPGKLIIVSERKEDHLKLTDTLRGLAVNLSAEYFPQSGIIKPDL